MTFGRNLVLLLNLVLLFAWNVFGADEDTTSHGSDHDSSTHGSSSASSHASDDSHATSSHGDSSHGDSSHGASDHGSEPNVFVLGSYFDYDTFVVLLSIVGCCAMVMELTLSKYEQHMKAEGDTFQSTLYDKIVRELMTLGVVSFALYLLQPVVVHDTMFLTFEFTHYVIFFVAIFTVLQLIILGSSTYPIKRSWDVAAYTSKEEVLAGYRTAVANMRHWSIPMPLLGSVSIDLFHWASNWTSTDSMQYHLARSIFIRQHCRSVEFDFARYACVVTDRQILSMADVPLTSWFVLLLLHWFAYGMREALPGDGKLASYHSWLVFGIVLGMLELLLLFACMLGMRRICVKLGADPADVTGTIGGVLDDIWVAPLTQVQHSREKRDSSLKAGSIDEEAPSEEGKTGDVPPAACATTPANGRPSGDLLAEAGGSNGGNVCTGFVTEKDIAKITVKDAFFVTSCNIHRKVVEMLMLLNSYYLAMYLAYFVGPAAESSDEWFWIIILPLPIIGGVLMGYRRVLPLIALLSTIVVLRPSDIAEVEQETEDTNKVRRKLVLRVQDVLQQELEARTSRGEELVGDGSSACLLIDLWDEDGNGTLDYEELEKGLVKIGLVLSSHQRRELFRLADPDRSGTVDLEELKDLLYDVELSVTEAAAEAAAHGGMDGSRTGAMMERRIERLLSRRQSSRSVAHR